MMSKDVLKLPRSFKLSKHAVLLLDFAALIIRYLDSMQLQKANNKGTKGQGTHKKFVLKGGLFAPLWQLPNDTFLSIIAM